MSFGRIAAEAAEVFFGDSYEIRKSFEQPRLVLKKTAPAPFTPNGGRMGNALRLKRTTSMARPPTPPTPQQPPAPQKPPQPPRPQVAKSGEFEIMCEITKMDTDKRQVFGWASVTKKDGELVKDLQGDMIDTPDLEEAAYEYILKSRKGGHEHQRTVDGEPVHVADIIESFVVTPLKKSAMGLPDDMPEGWWIGMKVNDDKVWELAKSGELAGFSVHGKGRRVQA